MNWYQYSLRRDNKLTNISTLEKSQCWSFKLAERSMPKTAHAKCTAVHSLRHRLLMLLLRVYTGGCSSMVPGVWSWDKNLHAFLWNIIGFFIHGPNERKPNDYQFNIIHQITQIFIHVFSFHLSSKLKGLMVKSSETS